jgi:hypothetical protein
MVQNDIFRSLLSIHDGLDKPKNHFTLLSFFKFISVRFQMSDAGIHIYSSPWQFITITLLKLEVYERDTLKGISYLQGITYPSSFICGSWNTPISVKVVS